MIEVGGIRQGHRKAIERAGEQRIAIANGATVDDWIADGDSRRREVEREVILSECAQRIARRVRQAAAVRVGHSGDRETVVRRLENEHIRSEVESRAGLRVELDFAVQRQTDRRAADPGNLHELHGTVAANRPRSGVKGLAERDGDPEVVLE